MEGLKHLHCLIDCAQRGWWVDVGDFSKKAEELWEISIAAPENFGCLVSCHWICILEKWASGSSAYTRRCSEWLVPILVWEDGRLRDLNEGLFHLSTNSFQQPIQDNFTTLYEQGPSISDHFKRNINTFFSCHLAPSQRMIARPLEL